jgi:hypothetical protein
MAESDKFNAPVLLSAGVESAVRKIAEHTGYTRDEVIEKMMSTTLDLAEASSERMEMPSF